MTLQEAEQEFKDTLSDTPTAERRIACLDPGEGSIDRRSFRMVFNSKTSRMERHFLDGTVEDWADSEWGYD